MLKPSPIGTQPMTHTVPGLNCVAPMPMSLAQPGSSSQKPCAGSDDVRRKIEPPPFTTHGRPSVSTAMRVAPPSVDCHELVVVFQAAIPKPPGTLLVPIFQVLMPEAMSVACPG